MTLFNGHTENAGHFLHPTAMAMGQTTIRFPDSDIASIRQRERRSGTAPEFMDHALAGQWRAKTRAITGSASIPSSSA